MEPWTYVDQPSSSQCEDLVAIVSQDLAPSPPEPVWVNATEGMPIDNQKARERKDIRTMYAFCERAQTAMPLSLPDNRNFTAYTELMQLGLTEPANSQFPGSNSQPFNVDDRAWGPYMYVKLSMRYVNPALLRDWVSSFRGSGIGNFLFQAMPCGTCRKTRNDLR